jgi:hypothetical protein
LRNNLEEKCDMTKFRELSHRFLEAVKNAPADPIFTTSMLMRAVAKENMVQRLTESGHPVLAKIIKYAPTVF